MTTAYGYLRVSGKGQINGDGPERQEAAIKRYAQQHDIAVVKIFFERGVCGEIETMERPAFIDMVSELGEVRTVIVEKLDRLSRHLITQETCIQDFAKQGLTLLSADSAEYDLMADDPSRVLVRQVFGAIAQYDKGMLVAKLRAARKRKKAAGAIMEGQKPYGSRPGERAIVGQITQLRSEGYSCESIANILNADGIPARTTGAGKVGKWHGKTVGRVISRTDSTESVKLTESGGLAA